MNENKTNKKYDSKMLEHLTLQDAITIVAISATQIDLDTCRYVDPTSCQDAIRFIESKERRIPIFNEETERTTARINLFMNFMQTIDPRIELEKASEVIRGNNMEQAVFELAIQVALKNGSFNPEKKRVLDQIASYLGVEGEISEKLINKHVTIK